ncbi:MAG: hypothetical protein U0796_10240 [Gemmatales bacterium]
MDQLELEGYDRDWFAKCKSHLCHFATMGEGPVPVSICNDPFSYHRILDYFQNDALDTSGYVINNNLQHLLGKKIANMDEFTRSFASYTRKGLYSFMPIISDDYPVKKYVLVSYPAIPLDVENIPGNIIDCIRFTLGNIEEVIDIELLMPFITN